MFSLVIFSNYLGAALLSCILLVLYHIHVGGVETGSMYVPYVPVI